MSKTLLHLDTSRFLRHIMPNAYRLMHIIIVLQHCLIFHSYFCSHHLPFHIFLLLSQFYNHYLHLHLNSLSSHPKNTKIHSSLSFLFFYTPLYFSTNSSPFSYITNIIISTSSIFFFADIFIIFLLSLLHLFSFFFFCKTAFIKVFAYCLLKNKLEEKNNVLDRFVTQAQPAVSSATILPCLVENFCGTWLTTMV